MQGDLKPGQRLGQVELAQRFDVSRIPVRDALAILAQDGVVTLAPNKGAYVVELDTDALNEVFDLRILLEADILRRAWAKFEIKALETLNNALNRSEIEAKTFRFSIADWIFHEALYAPAHRPRQLEFIRRLRLACEVHTLDYSRVSMRTDDWLKDHREIKTFIENQALEEAVQSLVAHLEKARTQLLDGAD